MVGVTAGVVTVGVLGMPTGHHAVPPRVTVVAARGRDAGHHRGAGGSDGCRRHGCGRHRGRWHGRPRHRTRGLGRRATADAGRALVGAGVMAGGGVMAGRRPRPRRPGVDHDAPRRTAATGGHERRRTVIRRPAPVMRRGALSEPAASPTVLRRSVERRRCRIPRRRQRRPQGAPADREREEPENHHRGCAGQAEPHGRRAQQPGERAR